MLLLLFEEDDEEELELLLPPLKELPPPKEPPPPPPFCHVAPGGIYPLPAGFPSRCLDIIIICQSYISLGNGLFGFRPAAMSALMDSMTISIFA